MTLEPFFHKRTSLQIGVCDSAWVSECLFCVWEFVFCVCACHLKRERERGIEEREKERERERDWRQDGGWRAGSDYGLEWLEGFLWRSAFSIVHSCVQAGAGSAATGGPPPEGLSKKRTSSEQAAGQDSQLVDPRLIIRWVVHTSRAGLHDTATWC